MSYTPNVPLANQRISSTQVPIKNNFTFLNADLQFDHKFNGNGPNTAPEGCHLQAEMPGQNVMSGSLTPGINGVYYVDTATPQANAQYYDGLNNYVLNNWRGELGGTFTLPATTNTTVPIGASIPNQIFGVIYFYGPNGVGITAANAIACSGVFFTSSIKVVSPYNTSSKPTNSDFPVALNFNEPITALTAFTSLSAYVGLPIWWTLFYRNRG